MTIRNETDLHDYQRVGLEHIMKHTHCGLLLDMGLGKTVTTLTAIKKLMFEELDVTKVLVIAPKRVADNVWTSEVKHWSHLNGVRVRAINGSESQRRKVLNSEAEIMTISRDSVRWLQEQYARRIFPFDMIVIDESSSFKNASSMRFKALRKLQPLVKRVVLLTGTPAPNSLLDLWPQIFLLDRGERLGKTLTMYREAFFKPNKRNGHIIFDYKINDGASKAIYKQLDDICMSMKASDYLNLPKRINNYVNVQLSVTETAGYQELERELFLEIVESGGEISAMGAASLTNKLQQYANGAVYDEVKDVHVVHNAKIEALHELIENAQGKPVLVAWTFKSDRDRILKSLKLKQDVHGKWPRGGKVRELHDGKDIDDWNAGEVNVMLMHPASGGHGLNLQAGGNTIVWFGITWSLELYQQFNARLDRQGQTESVIVHHLVAEGTVDETVVDRLSSKSANQDDLIKALKVRMDAYGLGVA